MPPLRIRLTKRADGAIILRCERPDGTVTWQRGEGPTARFFAMHDLTHYAVESVLGWKRGFFGLLSEGWNVTDFGAPWPRGRIPADAEPAELVVGLLDLERGTGFPVTAAECNEKMTEFFANLGVSCQWTVSESELVRIRSKAKALWLEWDALPPDGTIELRFEPGVVVG